jgi:mannobiose 2-epimerase
MDMKQASEIKSCLHEARDHLKNELLPFWLERLQDDAYGGYRTHFDQNGDPSGETDKSLIAQTRSLYMLASALRAGWGNPNLESMARHGLNFLLNKMWDGDHHGFYWMADRSGKILQDKKIVYGQSFAIYALSEYTLATGDPRGLDYAEKTFDALQMHCLDPKYGGYFEMFERPWTLCGPGRQGGDRKTLDVHMHLMEAFTTLYECSKNDIHRQKLVEVIQILLERMLHPIHGTGISQFTPDWRALAPIRFEMVWGWDRFPEGQRGEKGAKALDHTSYGHNIELAWLLLHAFEILEKDKESIRDNVKKLMDHAVDFGLDDSFGGIYVEGPHQGEAYDLEKEFWQQAEALIGLLDACLLFGMERYWAAYRGVHRFVFDRMIHHAVGEWWPLLTREGEKIWTHMSHAWKVNYHTVRSMIQSIARLEKLLENQRP